MRFVRTLDDPPDTIDAEAHRQAVDVDGVDLAVPFGSYAQDDADRLSDLDVAVRFDADIDGVRKRRLPDELTVAIQESVGVEAVDLVDLDAVGPRLGYEVLARGVLVCGDPETAIDLEAEFLLKSLDFEPAVREWQGALDERIREGTFGRP